MGRCFVLAEQKIQVYLPKMTKDKYDFIVSTLDGEMTNINTFTGVNCYVESISRHRNTALHFAARYD